MRFDIHLHIDLSAIMLIADELVALRTGINNLKTAILASIEATKAEVAQHNDEVTTLKARIAELEALPTITAEQQTELDALRTSQDELLTLIAAKDPTDPTTIPTDPPTNA